MNENTLSLVNNIMFWANFVVAMLYWLNGKYNKATFFLVFAILFRV